MENIDKIIRNLYLCTTNSREKMQQTLIQNILYSTDTPIQLSIINDFIRSEFHLEIDNYELTGAVNELITQGLVKKNNESQFYLTDECKSLISKNVVINN